MWSYELRFSWDEEKNRANRRKHFVRFEDATDVFFDPHRLEIYDDRHEEDRWIVIGVAEPSLLVVACTVHDDDGEVIRLISARRANAQERRAYRSAEN